VAIAQHQHQQRPLGPFRMGHGDHGRRIGILKPFFFKREDTTEPVSCQTCEIAV
jgi:hypothetical protein